MAENTIIHEISLAGYKATSTGGRRGPIIINADKLLYC